VTGIINVAHLTLFEARRRRILLAAAVCGTGFLGVFGIGLYVIHRSFLAGSMPLVQQRVQTIFLTISGLYVENFLMVAMAVLLSVDTLSGEIASGVIDTLASKPIRRAEIVLGKWLAYWILMVAYLVLLVIGLVTIVWAITGFRQPNIGRALPLMALEGTVLLTISIAGGTTLSTVTNGIVAFGFFGLSFAGGVVEQIGAMTGNLAARNIGTAVSLVSPGDALWRMAAHYLQPPLERDLQTAALYFATPSNPTPAMIVWAAGFVLGTLLYALHQFHHRPL